MNTHVLPTSDRRATRAMDLPDALSHYFAAPLGETPNGRRVIAAPSFDPPDWTDFDRSYSELSGGY